MSEGPREFMAGLGEKMRIAGRVAGLVGALGAVELAPSEALAKPHQPAHQIGRAHV